MPPAADTQRAAELCFLMLSLRMCIAYEHFGASTSTQRECDQRQGALLPSQ
jgi:hypothetical protein